MLAVLSDGMGNGKSAERYSDKAVALIENLFETGYPATAVTKLGNKFLSIDKDGFSACDIVVIDLRKGVAEFIKAGSAPSYIVKNGMVDVIQNKRTPLGILQTTSVLCERISIDGKTFLALMTDGVTDALSASELTAFFKNTDMSNPETAAGQLINAALNKKGRNASFGNMPHDDMGALILRIYKTTQTTVGR